jgi:hypothetical protein
MTRTVHADPTRGRPPRLRPRWLALALVIAVGMVAVPAAAETSTATPTPPASTCCVSRTTLNYVVRFFPRGYTWLFQQITPQNSLTQLRTGDDGLIGPIVKIGTAPNVDTVYGLTFNMNLSQGPEIVTLPPYSLTFSQVTLDVFGHLFGEKLEPGHTYALALPDWQGSLPPGVTRVDIPVSQLEFFLRADRYNNNVNTVAQAKAFIAGIRLASLPEYLKDPNSGAANILPQAAASLSTKLLIDRMIRFTPLRYLRFLQQGMHSPSTQPLSAADTELASQFDAVFANAELAAAQGNGRPLEEMRAATRDAFDMIITHYHNHVVPGTHWINFNNIADWGPTFDDSLDRSGIFEYFIFTNTAQTSRYWDAFTDDQGRPLNAATGRSYTITFSKADIPDARRFWSVTAYQTAAMNLTSSKHVAEYTPGLVTNSDGSITIYVQPNRPRPALVPNWLPVPRRGEFSVAIRAYGPQGNTAVGVQYIPPPIVPRNG